MAKKRFTTILKKFGLIPTYTEVSLFLMAITFLLLLIMNREFSEYFLKEFLFGRHGFRGLILIIFLLGGSMTALYYAFSKKTPSAIGKSILIIFAVFVDAFVGMNASIYILKHTTSYLMVFPILNFLHAILLLIFLRTNVINASNIADRNAKPREIFIGTLMIIGLFMVSQYVLRQHWAMTFSLVLAYTSMVNEIINKLFFRDDVLPS